MPFKSVPEVHRNIRQVESALIRTIVTLVVSSFSLVAALAWNTAVTKILENYLRLKPDSTIASWLTYAVVVTLLAVLVTLYVGKLLDRLGVPQEEASHEAPPRR